MLAVVTLQTNEVGRQYRLAVKADYDAVWSSTRQLSIVGAQRLPNGLSAIPDEPLPPQGTLGFRVQLYGMVEWGDLFTARQKLGLVTLCRSISESKHSPGLKDLLALVVDRVSSRSSRCLCGAIRRTRRKWNIFLADKQSPLCGTSQKLPSCRSQPVVFGWGWRRGAGCAKPGQLANSDWSSAIG